MVQGQPNLGERARQWWGLACAFLAAAPGTAAILAALLGIFAVRIVIGWYLGLFGLPGLLASNAASNVVALGLAVVWFVLLSLVVALFALPQIEHHMIGHIEPRWSAILRGGLAGATLLAALSPRIAQEIKPQSLLGGGLAVSAMLLLLNYLFTVARRWAAHGTHVWSMEPVALFVPLMPLIWLCAWSSGWVAVAQETAPNIPAIDQASLIDAIVIIGAVTYCLSRLGRRRQFYTLYGLLLAAVCSATPLLPNVVGTSLYWTNAGGGRLESRLSPDKQPICDVGAFEVHFYIASSTQGCQSAARAAVGRMWHVRNASDTEQLAVIKSLRWQGAEHIGPVPMASTPLSASRLPSANPGTAALTPKG